MSVPPRRAPTVQELQARLAAERGEAPYLILRDEEGRQRIVLLSADLDRVAIGRRAASGVPLPWDDQVSRLHALLERVAGEWTISDDGLSRNGSFVNGVRLGGRRRLRDGDALRFGRTLVEYHDPAGGDSRAATRSGDSFEVELTVAQRSVLFALCRPFADGSPFARPATNQEIAEELSYSVDGVKAHLRTLFRKFEIGDLGHNEKRLELVERAVRAGIASPRAIGPPPG